MRSLAPDIGLVRRLPAKGLGQSAWLLSGEGSFGKKVQLLLGHTKLESTVRYLGIEVDDALAIRSRLSYSDASTAVLGQPRTTVRRPLDRYPPHTCRSQYPSASARLVEPVGSPIAQEDPLPR